MSIESAKNSLSIALSILKDDVNVNNVALVQLEQTLKELEAVPVQQPVSEKFTVEQIYDYVQYAIEHFGTLHETTKHINDPQDGIVAVSNGKESK